MLTDPLSITYDTATKNLARGSGYIPGTVRLAGRTFYRDSGDEFSAFVEHSILRDGSRRSEILLGRTNPDTNPDPSIGNRFSNYVGLVYMTNSLRQNTSVDIPQLQTSLLSLVTPAIRDRLISGEG